MQFDVIVIGAGMAGLYQLYSLREQGMSVRVLEAGPEVGGTWYWNRYPGARFDSESFTYGYSFSQEVLEEWEWTELFAGQPETLDYIRHVADKFDLRRDIDFDTRVASAAYDEAENCWTVITEDGRSRSARYVIAAVGPLSAPNMPAFPGQETFAGTSFHTLHWPEDLDLAGRRVAVIGTGATGIQIIQTIAPDVEKLTVYQRGGNWAKPLWNRPIDESEMRDIRHRYPEIFNRCKSTAAAFMHDMSPVNTFDVSDEERQAFYEQQYALPGFAFILGGFQDVAINERAANAAGEFLAAKIRARVNDPKVAEVLIPTDHPVGAKRMPMETNYYETYNRDNVELVDLRATPVERITEHGIVTGGTEREFDVIVYATGFDAFRGGLDRIEFRGIDGQRLVDKWAEGVSTYLGFQYHGFPNLFAILGPLNGGSFCNYPRCIEQNVEFLTGLLSFMRDHGYDRVEPSIEAESAWTQSARDLAAPLVASRYDSYANSANTQASKTAAREMLVYFSGQKVFRDVCREVIDEGYKGFEFSTAKVGSPKEPVA